MLPRALPGYHLHIAPEPKASHLPAEVHRPLRLALLSWHPHPSPPSQPALLTPPHPPLHLPDDHLGLHQRAPGLQAGRLAGLLHLHLADAHGAHHPNCLLRQQQILLSGL